MALSSVCSARKMRPVIGSHRFFQQPIPSRQHHARGRFDRTAVGHDRRQPSPSRKLPRSPWPWPPWEGLAHHLHTGLDLPAQFRRRLRPVLGIFRHHPPQQLDHHGMLALQILKGRLAMQMLAHHLGQRTPQTASSPPACTKASLPANRCPNAHPVRVPPTAPDSQNAACPKIRPPVSEAVSSPLAALLARPKSITFTVNSSPPSSWTNIRFDGLMSRCTRLCFCAALKARLTCEAISKAIGAGIAPRVSLKPSTVSPSMNSIA